MVRVWDMSEMQGELFDVRAVGSKYGHNVLSGCMHGFALIIVAACATV